MNPSGIRNIRPSPDTLHQILAGEAVLLNTRTDDFYALNPVATRIWELVVEVGQLDRILARLQAEYEASSATIAADVMQIVDRWRELELVEVD